MTAGLHDAVTIDSGRRTISKVVAAGLASFCVCWAISIAGTLLVIELAPPAFSNPQNHYEKFQNFEAKRELFSLGAQATFLIATLAGYATACGVSVWLGQRRKHKPLSIQNRLKVAGLVLVCSGLLWILWAMPLAGFHHMELVGLFGWLFINGEDPDARSIFYFAGREYVPTLFGLPLTLTLLATCWLVWKSCQLLVRWNGSHQTTS